MNVEYYHNAVLQLAKEKGYEGKEAEIYVKGFIDGTNDEELSKNIKLGLLYEKIFYCIED